MQKNKTEFLGVIVFLSVGIIFLVVGLLLQFGVFSIDEEDRIYTTATITRIDTYHDSDGDTSHKVYVEYQVDDNLLESKLNTYVSSYYEGKEIDVYYDKNNPSRVQTDGANFLGIIFIVLGGILAIFGAFMLFVRFNGDSKARKLKLNGERVDAEYVETIVNTYYTVNGRNPYQVICKWKDPSTGDEITFKSKNLWEDPEYIIQKQNIKVIPVYIDSSNHKKYFVDVEFVVDNFNNGSTIN